MYVCLDIHSKFVLRETCQFRGIGILVHLCYSNIVFILVEIFTYVSVLIHSPTLAKRYLVELTHVNDLATLVSVRKVLGNLIHNLM